MQIKKKFNTFTYNEYIQILKNYKKYTNFNTLGLYRSIIENKKLSIDEKIKIRKSCNEHFFKFFQFLQIKDVNTYVKLVLLGEDYTEADKQLLFDKAFLYKRVTLSKKKIKHDNIGTASKHMCGHDDCSYNGIMTPPSKNYRKNRYNKIAKSISYKKERKNKNYLNDV